MCATPGCVLPPSVCSESGEKCPGSASVGRWRWGLGRGTVKGRRGSRESTHSQTKHILQGLAPISSSPGAPVSAAPPCSQKLDGGPRRPAGPSARSQRTRPARRPGSAPLASVTSRKDGCVWCWPCCCLESRHPPLPSLRPASSLPHSPLFSLGAEGPPEPQIVLDSSPMFPTT